MQILYKSVSVTLNLTSQSPWDIMLDGQLMFLCCVVWVLNLSCVHDETNFCKLKEHLLFVNFSGLCKIRPSRTQICKWSVLLWKFFYVFLWYGIDHKSKIITELEIFFKSTYLKDGCYIRGFHRDPTTCCSSLFAVWRRERTRDRREMTAQCEQCVNMF